MSKWIRKHKIAVIIGTVFIALCVILSISYASNGGSFVSNKLRQGNAAAASPVTNVVNGIKSGFDALVHFRSAARENADLEEEVNRLEKEVTDLTLKKDELEELRQLSAALNYESVADKYTPVTGNVVAFDGSDFFNIFTIDKGTESGIHKNCVVMAGNGLVGRVLETGNGFSKVISIIDEDVNISFQILRDTSIMGMISGSDAEGLTGFTFDVDAGVLEGDEILTTNIGIYPEGIKIGKITDVEYNNDLQRKTITVKPSVSFKNLKKVMVLVDEV